MKVVIAHIAHSIYLGPHPIQHDLLCIGFDLVLLAIIWLPAWWFLGRKKTKNRKKKDE